MSVVFSLPKQKILDPSRTRKAIVFLLLFYRFFGWCNFS